MERFMATSYRKKWFGWLRPRKSLALQLAEACESVKGLRKNGVHDDGGEDKFAYLKILDLANELREELLPRGIVIIPNDVECIQESWNNLDGRHVTEVRIKTEFEITDGKRTLVKSAYGSSRNGSGFALAIAQTLALKSWLKRLGLIFGEEDDAEESRWGTWPREAEQVRNYQERALAAALKTCGLTKEGVEALLTKIMGFPITTEGIAALPRKDFDVAMKALMKHGDLAEVLELSKQAATNRAKGPQAAAVLTDVQREIGAD
jgi:hypothetical protein